MSNFAKYAHSVFNGPPRQPPRPGQGYGGMPGQFNNRFQPQLPPRIPQSESRSNYIEEEDTYLSDIETFPVHNHSGSFDRPPDRNSVIGIERMGVRPPIIPSAAPPQLPQARRHSAAPFPNYTKWDPTKKASRFPPAVSRPPPLPPQSQDISGPAVDDFDQADYLTFEQPQLPERPYAHEPPSRAYPLPHHSAPSHPGPPVHRREMRLEDIHAHGPPPARPPRSPKFPGIDTEIPNEIPNRPPPPPPGQFRDSGKSDSSYSPSSSRNTSFKDEHSPHSHLPTRRDNMSTDSSYSSASSRAASLNKKDERPIISHLPNRKDNRSTGSSGSASSDELTQPLRPPRNETANKFVPLRPSMPSPSKFPILPRQVPTNRDVPRAMPVMPNFTSHSSPAHEEKSERALETEEHAWFIDGDRSAAQRKIEDYKQNGMFMVRPRDSDEQPYALTLWANNKFYNFVIRKKGNGKYALGSKKENERSYATVASLIEHHQSSELKLADDEGAVILTTPP